MMKILAVLTLLMLTGNVAWAQLGGNPSRETIIQNLGAVNQGMINPPGSLYYPKDVDLRMQADEESMTPVIEIQGEGVKPVPPAMGPVRSNAVRGNVAR